MTMHSFHGTTTINLDNIKKLGLVPPISSGIKTEKRKSNLDKVFLTNNEKHALAYAVRASNKFGGKPVIVKVLIPANKEQITVDSVLPSQIVETIEITEWQEEWAWTLFDKN